METQKKKDTSNKKIAIVIVIILVLIACILGGIYYYFYIRPAYSPSADPVVSEAEPEQTENTEPSPSISTDEEALPAGDTSPPVIALRGTLEMTLEVGSTYTEPGYSASDYVDGPLTDQVVVTGTVDTSVPGSYTITYMASDLSGNIGEVSRTIHVADLTPPVLTLTGDLVYYHPLNEDYTDPGFTCLDNVDGDLTDAVSVDGTVDPQLTGENILTYTVTDAAGNSTSLSRKVYVFRPQDPEAVTDPGDKVVYLTFDDGPSKHTLTLLDTLDKFGVHATFFVTNQYPFNNDTIGLCHRKGHTIALHTYSHKYEDIYKSEDNYFADLEKISKICEVQTGAKPTILRFPGGTSNSVSKKHKKGIMSDLIVSVEEKGYKYCDWNVDSGDAAGAKTSKEVSDNVIAGIQKHPVSVVLQHDTSAYSVEAVKSILYWGIENGYTFLPMTEDMEMIHFSPKN